MEQKIYLTSHQISLTRHLIVVAAVGSTNRDMHSCHKKCFDIPHFEAPLMPSDNNYRTWVVILKNVNDIRFHALDIHLFFQPSAFPSIDLASFPAHGGGVGQARKKVISKNAINFY